MKEKLSLPKGWEIKTIGDVCVSASSNVSQNKLANDEGDYPIYGASGLIKKVSFYHQDKPYLSIVKDGSGVGRVTKMDAYTSVIGTLQYILPKENIDLDYLNYSLMSVDFKKYVAGAAIPHIYFKDYKNEPFLWMPLPEQQRIVSILDEAFAAIARAKANAEQNLKNAKELFESYLQGVFENGNWETKTLADVCEISSKLIDPRKAEYQDYIHIGAGNIESMSGKLFELKTAREENLISGKFLFDESMVLYSKIRPYLMKVVNCDFQGLCSADIYPLKPFEKVMSKDYLYHLLLTKEFTDYAILGSQRAGMPKVNREHLFAYKFRLPQIKEQQTIVRQLDALRAETQKLEAVYQKKMDDLEELKKSILQKAFAGELSSSTTSSISVIKAIPLQKVAGIHSTDLQAGITAIAFKMHIEKGENSFHHIKAEKIVHLVESILNIDLERNPIKDAAGPNDYPHTKKVESRAKKAGFYTVTKHGEQYDFQLGKKIDDIIQKTQVCLGDKLNTLCQVIDLLVKMNAKQAEIVATVYAAWNNLILNGKAITNENIVLEARENWHVDKLQIPREKFFKAIEWIKAHDILIPKGVGKVVNQK